MPHIARVENGVVTQVIVVQDEYPVVRDGQRVLVSAEEWAAARLGGTWVRTSYNTSGGVRIGGDLAQLPLRKNYAGIGYTYDAGRDAFVPPQPFASWLLNEATCQWDAPVPQPDDGRDYEWNEAQRRWRRV
jgi:hypothetical protein